MKKAICNVLFLVFLGITFVACTKETSAPITTQGNANRLTPSNATYVNSYEYVGEIHNIVLKTALLDPSYIRLSNADKIHYITGKVNAELVKIGIAPISSSDMTDVWHYDAQIPDFSKQTTEDYYTQQLQSVSEPEKAILNQLRDALNQYGEDKDKAKLIGKKELLAAMVNSTIPEPKQALLLGAISLGVNSVTFWVESGSSVTGPSGFRIKPWLADVGGFVTGVTGTIIYNNNNGTNPDGNPIPVGVAVGTAASEAARK